MIRAMHLSQDRQFRTGLQAVDVAFAYHDADGLLWVDMQEEDPGECEPILLDTFRFHPLAVKNALRESSVPKLDAWGNYLYLVLHAVSMRSDDPELLQIGELDIFLGKHYIVTYHRQPIHAVDAAWTAIERDFHQINDGVDHILYRIAEEITGNFLIVADGIEKSLDRTETRIYQTPQKQALESITDIKRTLAQLARIIAAQQEVFSRLAREEFGVIDEKDRIYFRDVYDHMLRMKDAIEGVRDQAIGVTDIYLSLSNNRLTDVMRTLTTITTIFMPLTFVTGFFGMNFFFPEQPITELMHRSILVMVIMALLLIPVTMLTWMRRRGWLNP